MINHILDIEFDIAKMTYFSLDSIT